MKTLIGYNLLCFGISAFIVLLLHDGTFKDKMMLIIGEIFFMAILSISVWLLANG